MKYKITAGIVCILLLSGCVPHLTQQQCLTTNWYQMGFGDGSSGKPQRSLQRDIQDCLKFKIPVDTAAYAKGYGAGVKQFCTPGYELGLQDGQAGKPLSVILQRQTLCTQNGDTLNLIRYKQGRNKGLTQFCTYQNGLQLAASGQQPPQVCPPALQARFMRGWEKGQQQFCSNSPNGFAIGKAGRPFPGICSAPMYIAFRSEYQRGQAIYGRVQSLQAEISDINNKIQNKVYKYHLRERFDGRYRLGDKKTPAAKEALERVRHLARKRDRLKNQLYRAKTAA